eukprot:scaffold21.g2088.t1
MLANSNPVAAFDQWAALHNKPYTKGDRAEYRRRFEVFTANLERINKHNARNGVSYWLGLNGHADLTTEEFRLRYFGQNASNLVELRLREEAAAASDIKPSPFPYGNETPPKAVNWKEQGLLTHVKDQHKNGSPCGCCYAFSGVAALEAANALYTGKPVALSEQEIVDCDFLDYGCDGGDFATVFKWTVENGGIDTEEDYPYLGHEARCKYKKARKNKAVSVNGFVDVPCANETALAQAVTHTPTSTGICCGKFLDQWHLYKGGIFDESVHCNDPIDHAVLIAGYDTAEDGTEYWLIKNSWGEQWGEAGYGRFKRNVNYSDRGQSGLATCPAYAFKNTPNPSAATLTRRGDMRDSDLSADGTLASRWLGIW